MTFPFPILTLLLLTIILPCLILTREITFPPLLYQPQPQQVHKHDDGIDIITGSQFNGLMTFANLPYVNCFVDGEVEGYDIAILGAGFDTVSLVLRRKKDIFKRSKERNVLDL